MQASHVSTPIKGNVRSVGWVERSDTHQLQLAKLLRFAKGSTHPTGLA